MLHVITLSYIRPPEEVNAHLETHKEWLAKYVKSGHILLAGPMENRSGGMVLARCSNREELDGIIAQDSFFVNKVVDLSIQSFEPALRAENMPAL